MKHMYSSLLPNLQVGTDRTGRGGHMCVTGKVVEKELKNILAGKLNCSYTQNL